MKHFRLFVLYIKFLVITILISSCNNSIEPPEEELVKLSDKESWTIMVYMDGDNNLETSAIADINEMEGFNFSVSKINIIVLVDRISGYDSSNGDWTGTRLYQINYDSAGSENNPIISTRLASAELALTLLSDSELNMGDKTVLSNFIDFSKTNYIADNYALIIWNHGDGWRSINNSADTGLFKGICIDATDGNDKLYMKEVGEAVAGKGLDVLGFDACYMAMLEVAFEVKNSARYMIASESLEPGDGWEYDILLSMFTKSAQSPADLCSAAINSYYLMYKNFPGTTLSAIDLSKIDNVYNELNNFSLKLYQSITDAAAQSSVKNTILNSVEDYWVQNGSDINLDLWHLANVMQGSNNYCDLEASNLKKAVDEAVINNWCNSEGHKNSYGISIHFIIGTDPAINDYDMDLNYCPGYPSLFPSAFVNEANNKWNAGYSSGITGPGLLYRLWCEVL